MGCMHILSRRQFLFGAGAVSILTSAMISIPQLGDYPKHSLALQSLSDREVHIYHILGEWLLPPGGPLPGSGGDEITLKRIDMLLANLPDGQRLLLGALPLVFEHGTSLSRFGAARMTSMKPEPRDRYLRSWMESESLIPAQLVAALRTMYGMSYFERIDVQQAIQTPPKCTPV